MTDLEVYTFSQLYVFAAGNEGNCGGATGRAGTINLLAAAKNVLSVGAVSDEPFPGEGDPGTVKGWSSRGPCGDGRWKPNVVATGCATTSARGGTTNQYWSMCGTSMATPSVTGVMAGVMEAYPDVRANAALARAWAMATAVTFQGSTGTSSTHRHAYGLGRVSSMKAHSWGSSWGRGWAHGTVGSTTQTWDFALPSGVDRLVLVLTWDDREVSPGANPAVVKGVDLYLDREPFTSPGNSGEYSSVSTINTVEHIVVDNPTAGNYRVKVYPYSTVWNVKYGVMAVWLYGPPNPVVGLSSYVVDPYVRPNDTVRTYVTASSSDYIATNVFLDRIDNPGLFLMGTQTTLKDGVVLTNRHVSGDITIGDVLSGDPRSVLYSFMAMQGDAVRTASFSARSDNAGTSSVTPTVVVDGTPPPEHSGLASTTHAPNQWSNTRAMTFTWTQAPDNLSGNDGYAEAWASLPPAVSTTRAFGPGTSRAIVVSSDYSSLYYGIRGVDRSGNWNSGVSVGPYRIDTVAPGLATNLASPTHTPSVWSNSASLTVNWTAATDDRSGVSGYSRSVSLASPALPDTVQDIGAVTTDSVALGSTSLGQFYNLRTRDNAGNWSATAVSIGPFRVDTDPPTGPSGLTSPSHTVNVWSTNPTVAVTWTAAMDALSGLAGYGALWDQAATTDPTSMNLPATATSTSQSLPSSVNGHYVHIRARDNAGNWGTTRHLGPFFIDAEGPIGPTNVRSFTHLPNVWSPLANVIMTWNAAVDPLSGLAGYISVWDTSPATNPTGTLNLGATAIQESRTLPSSASGQYYHIRAQDTRGNWGTTQHGGPFLIDAVAPTGPTFLTSSTHAPNVWSAVTVVRTTWTAATDVLSGVAGYATVWDTSPTTVPTGTLNLGATAT